MPPEEIEAKLFEAVQTLRDEADSFVAILEPDDEALDGIKKGIDEVDAALAAITRWLCDDDEKGGN
jgi:hypothetical protein